MSKLPGFTFTTDAFEPGETWHSLDGGKTWKRGELPVVADEETPAMVVTKVDYDKGEITVSCAGEPTSAPEGR